MGISVHGEKRRDEMLRYAAAVSYCLLRQVWVLPILWPVSFISSSVTLVRRSRGLSALGTANLSEKHLVAKGGARGIMLRLGVHVGAAVVAVRR